MTVGVKPRKLAPLALSCTMADCERDLHCFRQTTRKGHYFGGPCRYCGKQLIDFPRVQAREVRDLDHTIDSLSREFVRHEFWERDFDQRALNHARRKGKLLMREAAVRRIRQSLGRARNPLEGRQTQYAGNVLFYAQHATATCCRKCAEYWHGIPLGQPLTEDQIAYLSDLLIAYIERRLPWLNDHPEKVPPIRRARAGRAADG